MKSTQTKILVTVAAGLALLTLPIASFAGDDASTLYKTKCAACHGPDGKGETAMGKTNKLRDMGSPDVQKQSDADLTSIIETGKGKMPPYGKSLKPEQVKDLVAYVRSFGKK
jgi:cytochrome c6